jgi:hypothetical protein
MAAVLTTRNDAVVMAMLDDLLPGWRQRAGAAR